MGGISTCESKLDWKNLLWAPVVVPLWTLQLQVILLGTLHEFVLKDTKSLSVQSVYLCSTGPEISLVPLNLALKIQSKKKKKCI